jgi:glycosyltransferase involved in cell wall biosynthesis
MSGNILMQRYWTINGRFLTQRITGVQRYAHEIIQALDELLTAGHPLADRLKLEVVAPLSAAAMPPLKSIGTRQVGPGQGQFWEQLVLPLRARGGILSLCNTSTILRRPQVVCIHDVNTILVPRSYTFVFRTFYHLVMPAVARNAAVVATVSEHSASNIAKLGWATESKLHVMPDGHEHVRRWTPRHSTATKAAASRDTVVVLGSLAPHKNVDLLVSSAQALAAHGLKLLVVGGFDRKVFGGDARQAPSHSVVTLHGVSDDELAALLKDSLCLAFPSVAEGFGLPPLEAMALGCPVVVSDRASLPEVCGEAALYASAEDAGEWLKCFLALRDDKALRDRQIARGLERAMRFQWRASAELYLQAMASVDDVTSQPR